MKKLSLFLLFSLIISCDDNPLGKTSLSSCDHAPGVQIGLPTNCQVQLMYIENLALWLDIHDSGTLDLENQSLVTSIADKSGSGFGFSFDAGSSSKASINRKSSNDRNAMQFNLNQGRYQSSAISGFGSDQSFSLAISFKTNSGGSQIFNINNGAGNGFEIGFGNDLIARYSLVGGGSTTATVELATEAVQKILLVYNSLNKNFQILNGSGEILHSTTINGSSAAWTNLFIEAAGEVELNELIVYREALTDVTTTQVLSYLNNKWGF